MADLEKKNFLTMAAEGSFGISSFFRGTDCLHHYGKHRDGSSRPALRPDPASSGRIAVTGLVCLTDFHDGCPGNYALYHHHYFQALGHPGRHLPENVRRRRADPADQPQHLY